MIKRVVIKDIATFDKKGVFYENLQKVNVIYGGNGTGKTTTSKVLEYGYTPKGHKLPTGETIVKPWKYPTCEVDWDGEPMRVLVYNRDFREQNLKESIPGVFTLGELSMNKDALSEIGYNPIQKFGKINIIMPNKNLEKVKEEYKRIEDELCEALWQQLYLPNRDHREMLKGYHRKETFAAHIRRLLKRKREGNLFWADEGGKAKDQFWKQLALNGEAIVENAENELAGLNKAIKNCQDIYIHAARKDKKQNNPEKLKDESFNLAKPSIDSINETLRLNGFTGFSMQPSPENSSDFQIQREDGSYVKDTLSEGEATIITFLYFMQIVEGHLRGEKSDGPKVVIIDDPISSLDYTAIDLVSTLTNDLIEKAKNDEGGIAQVFVLTHNSSYHKFVSINQPKKYTSYWKLEKRHGVSKVVACGKDNPVRGDYQELWAKLQETDEDNVYIEKPNLIRRIIDTYFLAYGGYDRQKLYAGEYAKDKQSVVEFVKWLEEGGQGNYIEKLKKLFEVMGHLSHYEMMTRG